MNVFIRQWLNKKGRYNSVWLKNVFKAVGFNETCDQNQGQDAVMKTCRQNFNNDNKYKGGIFCDEIKLQLGLFSFEEIFLKA